MHSLQLDFGKRGRHRAVRLLRVVLAALAAGAIALAAAGHLAYRDALHAWQLEREEAAAAASDMAPVGTDGGDDKARLAAQLERELAAPWEPLLRSFESVPAHGVALLELSADMASGGIAVTAEARDAASMHAYLQQLGAVRNLAGLHLVSQQVQANAPVRTVRFSAQGAWSTVPAAGAPQGGLQ